MSQEAIDAYTYPPTHDYDVATLEPRGVLAERLAVILDVCPEFFEGANFLDVGCSKGFFSLRAAREGMYVLAIEPDRDALDTWFSLFCQEPKITARNVRFRDAGLQVDGRDWFGPQGFDTVWVGNGPHYLYRDDADYMSQLAPLVGQRLVMEGPIGRECPDVADWDAVQEEADMIAEAEAHDLHLVARAPSPPYTPGRAVWHFKTR